ncbi:hypothetical protein QBC34DRAFT_30474 [Podospora aff. communis PSN243]|uniref:Ergosterol biosynthetic protein 28 n=1 Tax=Podospora aff. communis PSN243 TaxID=3040156 RepID=A0AAV9G3Y6_9PEZI|nr:hypothetical protein QBC34DRAFT_30474 [Podospora aff. communis PSN243]
MESLKAYIPSGEKGYLPYYLYFVGVVAIGNALQNLSTLHYTRRIYNGKFVPNHGQPDDSTTVVKPASSTGKDAEKAKDQITPLAARLMGIYTFMAGIIRIYASFRPEDPSLYQLGIWTHVVAAMHFTSELLVFKTIKFSGPQIFPFLAAYGGATWMFLQWGHYVQ